MKHVEDASGAVILILKLYLDSLIASLEPGFTWREWMLCSGERRWAEETAGSNNYWEGSAGVCSASEAAEESRSFRA